MRGQEKRKNLKNTALVLDIMHIVIGVLVVILGVVTFLNPEGNMLLFPIIFLLAAILNLVNGVHHIRQSGREMKKKLSGFAVVILGILLVAVAVISAISIWWR